MSFGESTKLAGFHMTSMDGKSWVKDLQVFYVDENGEDLYATNSSGGKVSSTFLMLEPTAKK